MLSPLGRPDSELSRGLASMSVIAKYINVNKRAVKTKLAFCLS
jgi:hypothetical protein